MNKLVFTLLFVFFITPKFYAQSTWERISPNPIESSLNEITRIPGTDRIMAIGAGASLLYTDDMGENWYVKYKPGGIPRVTNLNAIHFVNSYLGYVAGSNSTLIKTTDGGISWSNISPPGNSEFFDVFFQNELVGYITKLRTVLRTTDGCQTWDSTYMETYLKPNNLHFMNDSIGYVTSDGSSFYHRTNNGGESWGQVDILPEIENFGVSALLFLTDSIGYISGSAYYGSNHDCFILKTNNGGITWSQVNNDPFNFVHDIYFHNSDTGFAVGPRIMYDNVILKTTDSGETWQECEMPYSNWSLNSLTFSDDGIGVCVGRYGQIFSSYDWGLNWIKSDDHFAPLSSINVAQAVSDSVVYIGTTFYGGGLPSGAIYKSPDAGITWIGVFNWWPINSIHFITPTYGLACGTAYGEV